MNARLLYLIFASIGKFDTFLELIYNEQVWSLIQSLKILNHYKFKSLEDFLSNKKCSYYLEQESCIYSYYLVVGAFLQNLPIYMEFLDTNHIDFMVLSNEENRGKRGKELINMIRKTFLSNIYQQNMKLLFNNKNLIINHKNKIIRESLKMTCHEFV